MFTRVAVLALAASAYASPVFRKRQDITSILESVTEGIVSSATEAVGSATSNAVSATDSASSAASTVSDIVDGTPTSVPTESAAPSASASGIPTTYTCPEGFLLTYVEANRTIQASQEQLQPVVFDWSTASYLEATAGEGTANEPGSTRSYTSGEAQVEETLVAYTTDEEFVDLETLSNLTNGPIELGGTQVQNYTTVLQVIPESEDSTDSYIVKIYSNFCAQDQEAGVTGWDQATTQQLDQIEQLASGAQESGAVSSGASAVPSASSVAGGAAGSITSGASGVIDSITGGAAAPTSIAGDITSSIADALPTPSA